MKTKSWPNIVIALTVIGCSLVLLGALTIALGGFQLKKGGRTLEIEFRDATGVKLHSPVRYAGAMAGTVTRLRYLTPEERKQSGEQKGVIRVTVQLNDEVPPIPSNVTAGVASETLLGDKFIALTGGGPDTTPLADGAVIQAQEAVGFEALASSAQQAIENVNHLLARLNKDYPQLVPRLADLLGQGGLLLSQGSNFLGSANGALTNANEIVVKFRVDSAEAMSKLNALLTQGQTIATNTDSAIIRVDALVKNSEQSLHQILANTDNAIIRIDSLVKNNEPSLHQILEELRVVSQNLKVVSTYTKSLTGTLATKPSRLIWGGKKNPLPSERQILESSTPIPIELPKK